MLLSVVNLKGHPRLIQALAKLFSPFLKRNIDAFTEILLSVGAYGSLFCIIQGLVNPGDEASAVDFAVHLWLG